MLTAEENDFLTRVGPGTPAGELLRRYWQPVGMLPELTDDTPTKHVRIMGEDLVLFRDKSGRVGLLGDHCPHRGASLLYGRVEERGIACAYHGWLYDTNGNCLETPAEPTDSLLHLTVKHKAYPVREHYGMYWAYMGPLPAPFLPRYDLAEVAAIKSVGDSTPLDCNWLQFVDQNVDQAHTLILHQDTAQRGGVKAPNTTRGLIDELVLNEYEEVPFGIKRRQLLRSGYDDIDLMIFPTTLRIYDQFSVKVPIDDTHTRQYHVYVDLPRDGSAPRKESDGLESIEYYVETSAESKSPSDAVHPVAQYRMDKLRYQDFTVLETQGPIQDRRTEHPATSDRGVTLLRAMLKREIEKVQQGLDPIGVIRDPEEDPIDTNIRGYIKLLQQFPAPARGR